MRRKVVAAAGEERVEVSGDVKTDADVKTEEKTKVKRREGESEDWREDRRGRSFPVASCSYE